MSTVANVLLGEAIRIVLPIMAEQFATFAAEKEPEVKAYLALRLGEASPLVDEVFRLLVEPGLVTIGGLFATIGAPAAHPQPVKPVYPDYRDN